MLRSRALLWAGFLIGSLLMQSPGIQCSFLLWQMTSSGVMKGLFCLRGGSGGRWLDPIPEGSRCSLGATRPQGSVLCLALHLNEHHGMLGQVGCTDRSGLCWSRAWQAAPFPLSFHVHTMLYTNFPCTHLSARQGKKTGPGESPGLL